MALKKGVFIIALLITLSLLSVILILGNFLNSERKTYLDEQMRIINDVNELQVYSLMTDVYGDKIACLAFNKKLREWDQSLWDLGVKLESYRLATEEFQKDEFYLNMKKEFNDNEILYLMFLTKIDKECNLNQDIISFFYKNSEDCRKCDDQSFILTDIKQKYGEKVSIFSFDTDLDLPNVQILTEYYEIEEYPCIIINEEKYCGIRDSDFIIDKLCNVGGCIENSTAE